jgi:diguanylate cyclase (GGDEF)-like protein
MVAPRVAEATTLPAAAMRLAEELSAALGTPCAVVRKTGEAWRVEASAPRDLEWRTDNDEGTFGVPLGDAGGIARKLLIKHVAGWPGPEGAWPDGLTAVLRDALSLVAIRAEQEKIRQLESRCHRFACELLLRKGAPRLRRLIVEKMAQAVGGQTGSLALHLPAEDALAVVATYGYPSVLVDHVRVRPGDGVLGRVFSTRRPECARVAPSRSNPTRQRRYRADSYLAVPLITADGVLGVVSVTEPSDGEPFTRDHLAVLRAYAVPAALALARESLREQTVGLAHLATVDALTAISNRRHFDERLQEEIQRARRERSELALLMIDIDDFKALNDARGHQSGDVVLRQVAEILRRSVRTFDVCARYGGEEFAILMPGATSPTAFRIAERIRRHTESHFGEGWRYATGVRPTLSIGVSTARADMTGDSLVATADAALLWAKAAGKNVVKLYSDMPARSAAG